MTARAHVPNRVGGHPLAADLVRRCTVLGLAWAAIVFLLPLLLEFAARA